MGRDDPPGRPWGGEGLRAPPWGAGAGDSRGCVAGNEHQASPVPRRGVGAGLRGAGSQAMTSTLTSLIVLFSFVMFWVWFCFLSFLFFFSFLEAASRSVRPGWTWN